jgi:hypothetical protein
MRMRKGWLVVWPDGTEWRGDCPKWAAVPATPGSRVVPIRILGGSKWPCPACEHGTRH